MANECECDPTPDKPAGVAEENSRHAIEAAERLSLSCAQQKIGIAKLEVKSQFLRRDQNECRSGSQRREACSAYN